MVVVGFAAGGSAGKASDPGTPKTAAGRSGGRGAGREVETEPPGTGAEDGSHWVAPTLSRGAGPAVRWGFALGTGSSGKPPADDDEADPQDAERDDCTVEDLSFKTRELPFVGAEAGGGAEEMT